MKIIRWVLSIAMCICVGFEAGIVTAICIFLIFVAIELRHLPLKSDRRYDLQIQIGSIREILAAHWTEIIKITEKLKED